MDRPAHRLEPHRRAALRLHALDWWILGTGVLSLFLGRALYCRDAGSFQQCMRDGVPSFLALALQAGAVVLAVWAGSEVGRRVRSTWMGLTGGMIVLFALSAAVVWLGLAAGLQ